jgi:MFS family permease
MTLTGNLQNFRSRVRQATRLFITGGDWALSLGRNARHNLYMYWFDGLFATASDTIPINYFTLYLLTLGASGVEIGWYSALSSLVAALCLLPGAALVERTGRRREITVGFGGGLARLMLLGMALLPLALKGSTLLWVVIAFALIRSAAGNLAFPAWMSLTGDIVPMEGRGRYFGSRNFAMGAAAMGITYLVGEFITRAGAMRGHQLSLGMSFAVGMISTWFFSRIRDPQAGQPVEEAVPVSPAAILRDLRAAPIFLIFCLASALWNLSINVSGPFYNVYMAQDLRFTAVMIGVTSIATTIAKLFTQRKSGQLSDRWGPGRVQAISMFLVAFLPLGWVFITHLWQAVAINLVGGVFWGAFELASFNFLLQLTPAEQRARYSAVFQLIVTIALAAGAALGSTILPIWGINGIFLASAGGRLLAAFLFLYLMLAIKRTRPAEQPAQG